MTRISREELEDAYDFVADPSEANDAFLCRRTGKVYYRSAESGFDEVPPELEEEGEYVLVPHRFDLDLGRRVVEGFVDEVAPDLAGEVEAIFRRRGAYGRFRDLLREKGRLESWYEYENARIRSALREWCEEEGIELVEDEERPAE